MISLRKINMEDTENIVRWRNNPNVLCKFLDQTILDSEKHLNWYNKRIVTGDVDQFIIVVEGKDIGSVYLRDIDKVSQKAEFGIFIGDDTYLGRGYGNKATRLILRHAFDILNLNKVYLRVLCENEYAIKCYLNVGFKTDGVSRQDVCIKDTFRDIMFMSILKSEWEKQNCE